jgi:ABC-2 type transport system permease protein
MGASSDLTGLFSIMLFLLIGMTPFLTMRLFAEEYKTRTDQMLFTSPTGIWAIVIGKFLAAISVFFIALSFTAVWVVVTIKFGVLEIPALIGNFIAIVCVAGAFISVGIFVSSLTENQITAAVGTSGLFVALFALNSIAANTMSPTLAKSLSWVSLFNRHQSFILGIFSPSDLLYYISFTGVMLFMTARAIEARRYG